jgi:hypothetical protein
VSDGGPASEVGTYGWSVPARTADELAQLFLAMERHRYLVEVDLRLHWAVDLALSGYDERFARGALDMAQLRASRDDPPTSPDAAWWRPADVDEVIVALTLLWGPGAHTAGARASLLQVLREAPFEAPGHPPFASDPETPPHPQLIELDWVLLPVVELDPERHGGALRAMEGEEGFDPSALVYFEGPMLSERELCDGAPHGVLVADPMVWAEGPYRYCEYVLRGVARAAGLVDPPLGYRDIDKL